MKRVGVFGASFNPPTHGHKNAIEQARAVFDEIWLVPCISHPFGKQGVPIEHRLAMLAHFVQQWPSSAGVSSIRVVNIESIIYAIEPKKTKIYTFDVLQALTALCDAFVHEPVLLTFVVGPDNAEPAVWEKFYRAQEITTQWGVFVVKETVPIRSTHARTWLEHASAHSHAERKQKLLEYVAEPVADYILAHRLYEGHTEHANSID